MWLFDSFFPKFCKSVEVRYFRESLGIRDNESRLYYWNTTEIMKNISLVKTRTGIPLEAEFSSWLYGASLHRSFHYHSSIFFVSSGMCLQRRPRSVCAIAQSNQGLFCRPNWTLKLVSLESKCPNETLRMRWMNLSLCILCMFAWRGSNNVESDIKHRVITFKQRDQNVANHCPLTAYRDGANSFVMHCFYPKYSYRRRQIRVYTVCHSILDALPSTKMNLL